MHLSVSFLPAVHTITTISGKQREARLVTEDTVSPYPEVPPSVCSPPHTASSPVIQSKSGAHGGSPWPIAIPRNLFTMLRTDNLLRNQWIISTHRPGARMKRLPFTIRSTLGLRLWPDSSHPHASDDMADQCLGCVEKFWWHTLVTQPTLLPLLAENSLQLTIL